VKGLAVRDEFKGIFMVEEEHAEAIAERIMPLVDGSMTKPDFVFFGESL